MIKIIIPVRLGVNAIFLYDNNTSTATFEFDDHSASEHVGQDQLLGVIQKWLLEDTHLTHIKYGWDNFNVQDDLEKYLDEGENFFIITFDGIPTHEKRK